MINQIHTILNRELNEHKLNILVYPYDGIFEKTLCEAVPEANFYCQYSEHINWTYEFAAPDNMYLIEEPQINIPKHQIVNLAIINDRTKQYNNIRPLIYNMHIPTLEVLHCTTTNIQPADISKINKAVHTSYTRAVNTQIANSWRLNDFISYPIQLNNAKTKTIQALMVGDFNYFDMQIIMPILKAIPDITILGNNNELSTKFSLERTLDYIERAEIYINLTNRTDVPYFLLHAMGSGCAIVSNETEATSGILQHQKNCLISNTINEFINNIKSLKNRDSLRIDLSSNAYQYINEHYNYTDNILKWKKIIYDTSTATFRP